MHLATLVIRQRVLLQALRHQLVSDLHGALFTPRIRHQFQDVQQLAGITAGIAQQRIRLLHRNLLLLQFHILMQYAVHQLQEILFTQRLQYIHGTAREQWSYHLKGRILGGGTDERHHALLHGPQQGVLLRLGEAMNLVDEQDGAAFVEEASTLGAVNHVTHILHAARHSRQRVERSLQGVGDNLCQRRLADARRSPEDKARHASALYHPTNNAVGANKMLLAYIPVECHGAHAFC